MIANKEQRIEKIFQRKDRLLSSVLLSCGVVMLAILFATCASIERYLVFDNPSAGICYGPSVLFEKTADLINPMVGPCYGIEAIAAYLGLFLLGLFFLRIASTSGYLFIRRLSHYLWITCFFREFVELDREITEKTIETIRRQDNRNYSYWSLINALLEIDPEESNPVSRTYHDLLRIKNEQA